VDIPSSQPASAWLFSASVNRIGGSLHRARFLCERAFTAGISGAQTKFGDQFHHHADYSDSWNAVGLSAGALEIQTQGLA